MPKFTNHLRAKRSSSIPKFTFSSSNKTSFNVFASGDKVDEAGYVVLPVVTWLGHLLLTH
jgi:hypothetical protein